MSASLSKLLESTQPVCVIYGKDANANYPVLRLDYATLATGGTGFVLWWDGGFNNDSGKCYIVSIEVDPFVAIEQVLPICSHVVITTAAHDAIEYRGELARLEAMQTKAFDANNPGIDEATGTFGVHGYVVWGHNTNLEIPGCVIDFESRYECFYRGNTINANAKQMLLAYNDDPITLLRSARRRHSYVIITLRAMSRMQAAGHDLSSIRESTNPSEKRSVDSVREAARIIRSGDGNVAEARNTLSRYGFTEHCLAEITMSSSTQRLLDRIDRLCEISTGALAWSSKNPGAFPENKIGGAKGKNKARKVGQYGAKSMVNERSEDQSDDEIYDECRAYCRNATDRQLPNIYSDEKERGRRGGEVGRVAKIFARAAKDEMEERGLEESRTNENDAKSEYTAHANKLYKASQAAFAAADGKRLDIKDKKREADDEPVSRHATAWGFGYRTYLKTVLRGDDPTNTKPKGDHLAGWNQARQDLASLSPMTEATQPVRESGKSTSTGQTRWSIYLRDGRSDIWDRYDYNIASESDVRRKLSNARTDPRVKEAVAVLLPTSIGTSRNSSRMSDEDLVQYAVRRIDADANESASTDTKYRIQGVTFVVRSSSDKPGTFNVYAQRRNGLGFITTCDANTKDAVTAAVTAANSKAFESVNEVSGYSLKSSDKKAVDAWVQQQAKDGGWITNDGTTLSTTGMGSAVHAKWIGNKPFIGPVYGNVTQTLANYIRRALKSQGMTTIGRLDAKGNAVSEASYRSINDAAAIVPELCLGETQVWFAKPGAGAPKAGALTETHACVGRVKCNSHERLFVLLQEEKWSPKGEANEMLAGMGLAHRSLSVGDVLVVNGRARLVAAHGFARLEN